MLLVTVSGSILLAQPFPQLFQGLELGPWTTDVWIVAEHQETRHKRTASQKAIGGALGLHRVTTVRKAIGLLRAFGLAEAKGQEYLAKGLQANFGFPDVPSLAA